MKQGLEELPVFGDFLHDDPPAGIHLGDAPIVGQFPQNRNAFANTVISDPGVAQVGAVDENAERKIQGPDHFDGQAQIVQSEGAVFGHQQAVIASPDSLDDRARRSGRAVQDYVPVLFDQLFFFADDGGRHGLAHIQNPLNEEEIPVGSLLNPADLPGALGNGARRAEERAASASMAELGEDEHRGLENRKSIEPANFGAFPAEGAPGLVHFGNLDAYGKFALFPKRKKKMKIGFFHVAVEELNPGGGQGQV